jgi:hypothetical protein
MNHETVAPVATNTESALTQLTEVRNRKLADLYDAKNDLAEAEWEVVKHLVKHNRAELLKVNWAMLNNQYRKR